jgi:hypothetical protein
MLSHAVVLNQFLAQFIVPKLVVLLTSPALSQHSYGMLSHAIALRNLASLKVSMLPCRGQAQYSHSIAMACCRMRLSSLLR